MVFLRGNIMMAAFHRINRGYKNQENMMNEKAGTITMDGQPLTLIGNTVEVGEKAPDFEVTDSELKPIKFSEIRKGVTLLITVPSLDTSVCSKESKRFSRELKKLGGGVNAVLISMDLPFAQERWLKEAGIANIRALSDYRLADFGRAYGVLIKDLRLLARAVWIVDRDGVIRYKQLVKEVADEPDYDEVIAAVKNV